MHTGPRKKKFPYAQEMDVAQISWRELEPIPGHYDFDLLRIRIQAASKGGFGVELHIKGSVWCDFFVGLIIQGRMCSQIFFADRDVLKMNCLTDKVAKMKKIYGCNCHTNTHCVACEFEGTPDETGTGVCVCGLKVKVSLGFALISIIFSSAIVAR